MKLTGERMLDAPRAEVWAKLNDPEVLKRCIPGCESLEQVSPTGLRATVALKIGPISARFNGDVELSDMNPPVSYRISGKGSGGAVGQASGGANVRLSERDGGTLLAYDVDAAISGKIAQLGQRLIDATARQLADRFFDTFAAEFAPLVPTEANATNAIPARAATGSGRVPYWVWLAVAAGVVALTVLALR